MATAKRGKGTTARRRIKNAVKEAAAAMQGSNGIPADNGAAEAGSNNETNTETIRARAYEIFLARGAIHGHDLADWLDAERELRGARKPAHRDE